MRARRFVGGFGGLACLLVATASRAECAMDNDCPGDQICENAACVAPARAAATVPTPSNDRSRVASPAAQPAAAAVLAPTVSELDDAPRAKGPRHSAAMMVTGIVLTSLSPVALLVGTAAMISSQPKLFVSGYLTAFALAGAGIPLI